MIGAWINELIVTYAFVIVKVTLGIEYYKKFFE